jgi:hypothetical protein
MLVQRSKGPLPAAGDAWLISQDLGMWTFAAFVATSAASFSVPRVTIAALPPASPSEDDMWFNSANEYQMSVWDGTDWVAAQFGSAAIAPQAGITSGQVNFTATDIGGLTVSMTPDAPSEPADGALWYDEQDGYLLKQWNGSAWVPYQYGTGAIAAGSITAELIAANTITAAQLAAGIIYAGIIDGTIINAATFVGSVFEGTDFYITKDGLFFYSPSPGAGNLVLAVSPSAAGGVDQYGNAYSYGIGTYNTGENAILQDGSLVIVSGSDTMTISYTVGGGGGEIEDGGTGMPLSVYMPLVATAGTPSSPTLITTDTWHTISLDSGWSLNGFYSPPSYRLLPDGNMQLTGLADFGSSTTANHNLNNASPLPAGYRPATIKVFRAGDGDTQRGGIQISPSGVIEFLASPSFPARYAEIDAVIPLGI